MLLSPRLRYMLIAVSCQLIYAPLLVFNCIHDLLDDATILYHLMHEEGNV